MSTATLAEPIVQPARAGATARPRLGFLGVGWIGRQRMEAIARSGAAEVAAIADPNLELAAQTARGIPNAQALKSLDDLLAAGLDGIVIATPSALHADQAMAALAQGVAVFCQKPLGRNAAETRRVIDAARRADRLLGVDLSYRFVSEIHQVHDLVRSGALGDIFAIELVFHNAYGPDKPWYYDWTLAGGGCVIDLGIHLVDLALWMLNFPRVMSVTSRLFSGGKPMQFLNQAVEDYALARLDLDNGASVQLACSWKLPAGCEAVIGGAFYGTQGGASFHNVNGSFYDFQAERFCGTKREVLGLTLGLWGGRAVIDWAQRLAGGAKYDPAIESLNQVAATLDALYGRTP